MTTDRQLRQEVIQEMRREPDVPRHAVSAHTKDGVVTLHGTVEHEAHRAAAQRAAKRARGVREVVNDIVVRYPLSLAHADANIAMLVNSELDRHRRELPAERIHTMVSAGWVRLTGRVASEDERYRAERTVRAIEGVRGITDELTVHARPLALTTAP